MKKSTKFQEMINFVTTLCILYRRKKVKVEKVPSSILWYLFNEENIFFPFWYRFFKHEALPYVHFVYMTSVCMSVWIILIYLKYLCFSFLIDVASLTVVNFYLKLSSLDYIVDCFNGLRCMYISNIAIDS